nr:CHAT domain-containing protein [Lujinxingiaceae bacterium]
MSSEDILSTVDALQWRNDRPAFEQSLALLDTLAPDERQSAHALVLRAYALFRLDEDEDACITLSQALAHPECTGRTAVLARLRSAQLLKHARVPHDALKCLQQAHVLCDEAGIDDLRVQVVFLEARVHLDLDQLEQAEPLFREALASFEATNDLFRATWAFYELSQIPTQSKRLNESEAGGQRLLLRLATELENAAALADNERNDLWSSACQLARVLSDKGHGVHAHDLLIHARRQCGIDGPRYAQVLDEVAILMVNHDMPFVAECYEEILRDDLDPEARSAVHVALADILVELGENERARLHYEYALEDPDIEPHLHTTARVTLAIALMNEGNQADAAYVLPTHEEIEALENPDMLMIRGRAEAVLWSLRGANQRALEILARLLDSIEDEASPRQRVHTIAALASMAANARHWEFAHDAIEEAKALLATSPLGEIEVGTVHFSIGYVEMQCDEFAASVASFALARQHFQNAHHRNMWVLASVNLLVSTSMLEDDEATLRLADELEPQVEYHPAYSAAIDYQRGECYLRRGDRPRAIRHYERAAKNFARAGRVISEAEVLDTLAIVEEDPHRAIRHARKALQLVLALATFLDDEDQRLDLLASSRHIGARQAYLHLHQGDVAAALTTVFEVKSGDFLRLLYERRGTTPELDDALQNATGSATAGPGAFHPAMHMRPGDANASHRVLEKYMELVRAHPFATPQLVRTQDVLDRLGPDRLAIEYFLPDPNADHFLIFVAHDGHVDCLEQPWSPSEAQRVQRVLERVCGSRGAGSRVHARQLTRDLVRLYELFFAPLEARYLTRKTLRHLTLAPGADLVHVPFQACLTPDLTPLVNRFAIDFTLTLAQLAMHPQAVPHPPKTAAIWHPHDHTSDALPQADQEARWLHELLTHHGLTPTRVDHWTDDAIRHADLIHYAGHTHPHHHH